MKRIVNINPKYNDNSTLLSLIDGLPDSFHTGGELLWNKRNQIKAFGSIIAKRFKQPNGIQKLIYAFRKHKAIKAFENGLELIKRGIDTPEPMAVVELRKGPFLVEAYYFSQPDLSHGIKELTDRADWSKPLAKAFAQFVAQLHHAGILHHDLNNTNVLYKQVNATGTDFHFSVIDINRMTFYPLNTEIPIEACLDNLTRFTGRLDLFEYVVREYAKARSLDEEKVVSLGLSIKRKHDRDWYRRKRITHLFKQKKKQ